MPEISRFFGVIIRMYWEPNVPRNMAHFHAYCQDECAVFSIETSELIAGSLPKRHLRLVIAWAELHREELLEDWKLIDSGREPKCIKPLQ
ncbi:MAG: DUF4160 domain-containing protein [Pontiellaceae bacterium]|jgi:hypothetical protein|nr:DUF4160 domain-containing protein [Pontiellaceae bacterium]